MGFVCEETETGRREDIDERMKGKGRNPDKHQQTSLPATKMKKKKV